MRKDNLEDYELFYVEIPQAAHSDLEDVVITDSSYEPQDSSGLSPEQVSQIAKDSMEGADEASAQQEEDGNKLFNN